MRYGFYDSVEYKKTQSERTKQAWRAGYFENQCAKIEDRKCKRRDCNNIFQAKTYQQKDFCSQSCSAIYNNLHRGPLTDEWRSKISLSLIGKPSKSKGRIMVPRLEKICPTCKNKFLTERWINSKHCSNICSIRVVGRRPTSPRAARAKAGIRPDIDSNIYFFSRWEANFARIMNLLKIKWIFQPKTFNLNTQKYTPDFYLPDYNEYIEIKNFLSDYSLNRDRGFRHLYPETTLTLILKEDYLKLQDQYASLIKNWEFS